MILLFTDFGLAGPYVGQMHLVLRRAAPEVPVVDLQHDAPAFRPDLAAYLLASYIPQLRPGDIVIAVVDPGVGSARGAIALQADGVWWVGPDNGLLELVARRAATCARYEIAWRPAALSASFHGRDLFAPVAARLARGDRSALAEHPSDVQLRRSDLPPDLCDDLAAIVYIDAYGNAMTGLRAATLPTSATLNVGGQELTSARTFSDVPAGSAFWYVNSSGLIEIAANGASAATLLKLGLGDSIGISTSAVFDR